MATDLLLSHSALSDAATLSGSATAAGLGITNLQNNQPGQLTRFSTPGAVFIVADLVTAKTINLVALLYTNGTSSGTIRVRAATTEALLTTTPGFDSGIVSLINGTNLLDTNHSLRFLTTAQTFQFWRIDVVDAGLSAFDVGRLYISNAWQVPDGPRFGDQRLRYIDPTLSAQAVGGQLFTLERKRRRLSEFTIELAKKNELYNNAFDFDRVRGRSSDVLVIPDLDDTINVQRETVYGLFRNLSPILASAFNNYQKRFAIEEMIP